MLGSRGFGHVPRPRRNFFANQFAKVDSLADSHRLSSPPTIGDPILPKNK